MSLDRLETVRDCARRMAAEREPEPPTCRVVDYDGNTLREFVGAEEATYYNSRTPEAALVVRIRDGAPLTVRKNRQVRESTIDALLARAARSNASFAEDVESLPDADAAGEDDETEAA